MTPLAAETTAKAAPKNAVIMTVTINTIGNHRKVDGDYVKADTDKTMLNLTKRLIDAPEFKAIQSVDGQVRRYVEAQSLESPLKAGTYAIPVSKVAVITAELMEMASRRRSLVDELIAVLPRVKREAKERLNVLWTKQDEKYFDADRVRGSFDLTWQMIEFGTPDALKGISQEIYEAERQKAAYAWEVMVENGRKALAAGFAEVTARAAERLGGKEDGKKKIFRDSLIGNINDYFETFDGKNSIVNYPELKTVVANTKKLLKGVDPDMLRQDDDLRKNLAKQFAAVTKQINKLMTDKPKRQIDLD
jgi:hypothetical protein